MTSTPQPKARASSRPSPPVPSTAALKRKVAVLEKQLTSLRAETESLRADTPSNGSNGSHTPTTGIPGTMTELGAALDDVVSAVRVEAEAAFDDALRSAMDRITTFARERMGAHWVGPALDAPSPNGAGNHLAVGPLSLPEPPIVPPPVPGPPEPAPTAQVPVDPPFIPAPPVAPYIPAPSPTRAPRQFLAVDAILPMIAAVIVLMVVLAWVG